MPQHETLDGLRIASPCSVAWESMRGDDTVRVCDQCNQKVYHLSNLALSDARRVLAEHEGRVCGVLYRRHDGTVLTKDCPIGLRIVRIRIVKKCMVAAAIVLAAIGLVVLSRYLLHSTDTECIVGKVG